MTLLELREKVDKDYGESLTAKEWLNICNGKFQYNCVFTKKSGRVVYRICENRSGVVSMQEVNMIRDSYGSRESS